MGWLKRLRKQAAPPIPAPLPASHVDVPLLFLVHTHPKDAPPPGPLEEGFVELEQDDAIMHAVAGIVQPDGTIRDLPQEKLDWARMLTYRHLKREGCLADFGIPIIPAYEDNKGGES